jgi:hypothetical protein
MNLASSTGYQTTLRYFVGKTLFHRVENDEVKSAIPVPMAKKNTSRPVVSPTAETIHSDAAVVSPVRSPYLEYGSAHNPIETPELRYVPDPVLNKRKIPRV